MAFARTPASTPFTSASASAKLQSPSLRPLDHDLLAQGAPYHLDRSVDLELLSFDQLQASSVDLTDARLAEVALSNVHIASLEASRGDWSQVEISGRIGSLDAFDTRWRTLHLSGCKLDYVNLRGAELMDVQFTDCTIGELDLLQATLRRVRFTDTSIDSLAVRQSRLRDVDLRGAAIAEIDGLLELAGATISTEQAEQFAPRFAAELNIRVG